jgi:hypothetical protein
MTLAAPFNPGRFFFKAVNTESAHPNWGKINHQPNQGRFLL